MKKIAILFLLTIVFASFVFAQEASVTTKLEFVLKNVNGAKDYGDYAGTTGTTTKSADDLNKKMEPYLILPIVSASASVGDFDLGADVAFGHSFGTDRQTHKIDTAAFHAQYNIAAGPGSLGIFLNWNEVNARLEPGASYSGLVAGPVTLGFNASFQYNYANVNEKGKPTVFNSDTKRDTIVLGVNAGFDFGLNIAYTFKYDLGIDKKANGGVELKSGIGEIAMVDVSFNFEGLAGIPLTVGIATENTGETRAWAGKMLKGFRIDPYASYQITDAIAAGLRVRLENVADDNYGSSGTPPTKLDFKASKDLAISPAVWLSYTF
jgi:hypothetical protein